MTTEDFIKKHEADAVNDSIKSGVPASITMAQAIVESGHGNSMLYQVANNSFGIKCAGGWKGPGVLANDDRADECFRKYESVGHSFRDHSDFLKKQSRYKSLFDLPKNDYKSWAYGLKKAGYATAQNYAQALIERIEKYQLYKLDRKVIFKKIVRFAIPILLVLAIIILLIIRYRMMKKQNLKKVA